MSSKQQLMDYNKRLKNAIHERDEAIHDLNGKLKSLINSIIDLKEQLNRKQLPWWKKIFNQ